MKDTKTKRISVAQKMAASEVLSTQCINVPDTHPLNNMFGFLRLFLFPNFYISCIKYVK